MQPARLSLTSGMGTGYNTSVSGGATVRFGSVTVKNIGKRLIWIAVAIAVFGVFACTREPAETGVEAPAETPVPQTRTPETAVPETPVPTEPQTEEIVIAAETAAPETPTTVPTPTWTPAPTEEPTPVSTEEPTPVPSPVDITIGAVGDIMIPSQIVEDAKLSGGEYAFDMLFAPVAELFQSVDLMCGNLETPLAGKEEGFSQRKDSKTNAFLFNAPDSVLDALKASGMDMLTTANNHCLDMGGKGMYRTIEAIRAAGFYQTGTYLNAEDREEPCVVEISGVRVGFVASTKKVNVNHAKRDIGEDEKQVAIGYLIDGDKPSEAVLRDIARVREAGAEFVILFAHWDFESDNPTADSTKKLAKALLAAGADCIIGSHPHRIKGAEYVTVQREDGPYTGLVLYSLGNFTANNRFELMVGLFARITLHKDFGTGRVTLQEARVLPTITIRRSGDRQRFTVVPAYADPSAVTGLRSSLTASEIKTIAKAREHAFKRLGRVEGLLVLDEP